MKMKKNCWEVKKCGREKDGENIDDLGICPASVSSGSDGINGGKNGGRICWAIAGTYCDGKIQGEFADKQVTCIECDFFKQVLKEEKESFHLLCPGQQRFHIEAKHGDKIKESVALKDVAPKENIF